MTEFEQALDDGRLASRLAARVVTLAALAGRFKIYLVFLLIAAGFAITSPVFLTPTNWLNIGRNTALVSIVAVGMTFVIISGEIDLSVASVLALSGMTGAMAMAQFDNQWYWGVAAALATGAICGLLNGLLTTRLAVPSFLITIGTMSSVRGVAMLVTGTVAVPIISDPYNLVFGGGYVAVLPVPIVWTVIVVVLGILGMHYLSFGRKVYATGGNANAARYSGINTGTIKTLAFLISGLCASLAGIVLCATTQAARPDFASGMELDVLAAVILGGTSLFGGKGTILGSILGSLMIGVLNNGLTLLGVNSSAQQVAKGIIIIAAVSLAREGGFRLVRRK
jgi:ribose transport system permease protein